jgi:hypothetical protein
MRFQLLMLLKDDISITKLSDWMDGYLATAFKLHALMWLILRLFDGAPSTA